VSRKGQSITLAISDRDKAQLEQIALALNIKWGERPNISKLVEAIARRKVQIGLNNDWSDDRIAALEHTYRRLSDAGEIELARAIATILSERSELSIPLHREIERFLESPPIPWRQTLDQYIYQQRPFKLNYRDAADRSWTFTIRHAAIALHDKRQYLDCWCEETDGNLDIDELKHNRCLLLDRIPEAAITPVQAKWRSQSDKIPVTIHLLGSLAFAYKSKTNDLENDWLPDQPVRRVVKTTSSTFWFFREILPYGEDCVIVAPDSVREKFVEKLRSLWQSYKLTANS
jgi:predicted DNA-binding transcriptional regulator YafY